MPALHAGLGCLGLLACACATQPPSAPKAGAQPGQGAALPAGTEAGGEPEAALEQPADPTLPWRPEKPPALAGGLRWGAVEPSGSCADSRSLQRLTVISSAQQYREQFCVDSEVDWSQLRLVIVTGFDLTAPREPHLVEVTRDAGKLVLVIEHAGRCRDLGAYSYYADQVSALVPAGNEPIVVTVRPAAAPPCPPGAD